MGFDIFFKVRAAFFEEEVLGFLAFAFALSEVGAALVGCADFLAVGFPLATLVFFESLGLVLVEPVVLALAGLFLLVVVLGMERRLVL